MKRPKQNEQGSIPADASTGEIDGQADAPQEGDETFAPRDRRRAAKALLDELGVPQQLTMEQLHSFVESFIGSPVRIVPLREDAPRGLCAMLTGSPGDGRTVHYHPGSKPLHKDQCVCHEYGHLLCGHTVTQDEQKKEVRRYTSHLDGDQVDALLREPVIARADLTSRREQLAEAIADELMMRTREPDRRSSGGFETALT